MRIAICVKQVPAASDVQIDRQTKRLRRDKAPAVMNECDRYALELALRLREENGASITAFSMGPPQAARVTAIEHASATLNIFFILNSSLDI